MQSYDNYTKTGPLGSIHGGIPVDKDGLFDRINDDEDKAMSDARKRSSIKNIQAAANKLTTPHVIPENVRRRATNVRLPGYPFPHCVMGRSAFLSTFAPVRESLIQHFKTLKGMAMRVVVGFTYPDVDVFSDVALIITRQTERYLGSRMETMFMPYIQYLVATVIY